AGRIPRRRSGHQPWGAGPPPRSSVSTYASGLVPGGSQVMSRKPFSGVMMDSSSGMAPPRTWSMPPLVQVCS
ncbi:MAG: hypothetical protein KY467_12595, partial [Gemmatimonadetes bacterium]|nr:hypothetical protein [Gemmatimonadota bacterium]